MGCEKIFSHLLQLQNPKSEVLLLMNLLTNFLMISPEIQKKENSNVFFYGRIRMFIVLKKQCFNSRQTSVVHTRHQMTSWWCLLQERLGQIQIHSPETVYLLRNWATKSCQREMLVNGKCCFEIDNFLNFFSN